MFVSIVAVPSNGSAGYRCSRDQGNVAMCMYQQPPSAPVPPPTASVSISQKVGAWDGKLYTGARRDPVQSFIESLVDDQLKKNAQTSSLDNQKSKPWDAESARGDWKVVSAPHLAQVSRLGVVVGPVYYRLSDGQRIESVAHVQSRWLFLDTWLGAAGTYTGSSDDARANARNTEKETLQLDGFSTVDFTEFWVGDSADSSPPSRQARPLTLATRAVNGMGRALFFKPLSQYPVEFLDMDAGIVKFEFPALGVRILAARLAHPLDFAE